MNTNLINKSIQEGYAKLRCYIVETKIHFPVSIANISKHKTTVKKVQTSPIHNPSKLNQNIIDKTDDLVKRTVDWENDAKAK